MIAKIDVRNPRLEFADNKYSLKFDVIGSPVKSRQMILTVKEKQIDKLTVEVDKPKSKRSLRSNAFMWEICGRIAELTKADKNDIYRMAIRETDNFYQFDIKDEEIDHFKQIWKGHGEGWFADVIDYSEDKPGHKKVFGYYGSSQYDTVQMADLIERVLQGAKDLGIEVLSEREKSLLEMA